MLRKILRPEFSVYLSLAIFAGLFFVLNLAGTEDEGNLLSYYISLTIVPLTKLFKWVIVFLIVNLIIRLVLFLPVSFKKNVNPEIIFSRKYLQNTARSLLREAKVILTVLPPIVLSLFFHSVILGRMNAFNAGRLRDELLMKIDFALTGTYPFMALAKIHYPDWFVGAVEFSFKYLIPILIFFAFYLFQRHRDVFRECASAFFLGLLIMMPLWTAIPVLSPHDRFIDNVYERPVPRDIKESLREYDPQASIAAFLQVVREKKEKKLKVLPTSTIPSAHVAWAVFILYYAYRARRGLALLLFPVLIFSTLGTVLFAQHYFADVPAGIIVAVVSIVIARYLMLAHKRLLEFSSAV